MKIKSLLIGSAALMTVSTGSYAADAVVMAEPEPVEYVRVCDVYGAGFFYIPGTETCLRIGGYVRYEMAFSNAFGIPGAPSGWGSRARFAPVFDARTETEWGTIKAFAELEIGWTSNFIGSGVAGPVGGGMEALNLPQAYIEVQGASGTLRLGHGHRPYARFLGYGSGNVFGGVYGYAERNEISYTFNGGNGFTAVIAAVEDNGFNWMPDLEGGINFRQGWGSVGAIVGYDESANTWGAKGVLRLSSGALSGGLHVFYSSGAGSYAIIDPVTATVANWSVLGHAKYQFTPTVAATASVQWFNVPGTTWDIVGGLDITPFGAKEVGPAATLRIRPEIRYSTNAAGSVWGAALRFDRNF